MFDQWYVHENQNKITLYKSIVNKLRSLTIPSIEEDKNQPYLLNAVGESKTNENHLEK